jgi:hypothetical protein
MQTLLTILGVIPFVLLGLFVFWIIAGVIIANSNRSNTVDDLEADYATRQIARRDRMTTILYQIGKPEQATGKFNDAQNDLWTQYRKLEEEDRKQTEMERDHIVSLQVHISDEEQAELDAGINPYRR